MEQLRAQIVENAAVAVALGGLVIGIVFGAVVQRTNFCTMGSLSDMLNFGDGRRFRSWWLATATAIVGVMLLRSAGWLDTSRAMYLSPTFDWAGAVIGGLMFGFGMVFGGGCASRNLVRIGTGDLRSLVVVVVIAISGYMAMGGLLGPTRASIAATTAIDLKGFGMASQGLGAFLARFTGMGAGAAETAMAVAVVVAILAWCFAHGPFRSSPVHIAAGIGVGVCVVAGWALTGLAFDDMADTPILPTSLTFVRPAGDALDWLQRYTAVPIPNFGVATVFGTILGAFLMGTAQGKVKLATFYDVSDTLRNLFGAVLMGVGGVVATGCTVGQAVTGASTLALSSFLVFFALIAGGIAGMKVMERMD